jgi:hypothetical protein
MITKYFLWSIVLLYSFHFAGHLHNLVTNIPNWSSGTVEDMNRYSNFYHRGNNTYFFAPVIFASIIVCTITLLLVWNTGGVTRKLVLADLAIAVAALLAVFILFRPMNMYFEAKQYEPGKLKAFVDKWVLYNYIRMAFILAGLIFSIWALNTWKR